MNDKNPPPFYEPSGDCLAKLNGPWCCSYSGGKDSTSLVTWIEWLRRLGRVTVESPQLVQSDTGVEDYGLSAISHDMMALLRRHGWTCVVVEPRIHEKLYNRILGIGNTPIHPGSSRMRWCTRSTKISPMERWRKENSAGYTLTGLRYGESTMRDGKLKRKGCSAGGECGMPDASDRTYSPIINWRACSVVDWLTGAVGKDVREVMADVFKITYRLVEIYDIRIGQAGFEFGEPEVKAARYGCIGCPAISASREAPASVLVRNGLESPLNELYDVWFEARRRSNRLWGERRKKQFGPIKMAVRRILFDRVMDIQRRAGVTLITKADERFIKKCWRDKVYPRGWSEADEHVVPPSTTPLFEMIPVQP